MATNNANDAEQKAAVVAQMNKDCQLATVENYQILTHLAFLVSKAPDFPLAIPEDASQCAIKFRYPESFKACYAEIRFALDESLTESYLTMSFFSTALPEILNSMDKIQRLFEKNETSKMEKLLKIYLKSPENLMQQATKQVEKTIEKYDYAGKILKEIIVRASGTMGRAEQEKSKFSMDAKVLEKTEERLQDQMKHHQAEVVKAKERAMKAERELDKSVENRDSLWTIFKNGIRQKLNPGSAEGNLETWKILEIKKTTIANQLRELEKNNLDQSIERNKVIEQLTKVNFEKETQENIIEKVKIGLKHLEQMKAQWTVIQVFFKEFEKAFEHGLKGKLTEYLDFAKEKDTDLMEEMKESTEEVKKGCDAIYFISTTYRSIHLRYLEKMMLVFPKFSSGGADVHDRAHLDSMFQGAIKAIQMAP